MMEERKSNKGLVVLIVILIILLLGAGAFIYYGYSKYENLNSDYNKLSGDYDSANKELNKSKSENDKLKNVDENNYVKYGYGDSNIYAVYPFFVVYSFDNEFYLAEDSLEIPIVNNYLDMDNSGIKFKNDKATIKYISEDSDENKITHEIGITKLNLKEDDVYKAIAMHAVGFGDPTGEIFILLKDGGLRHYFSPSDVKINNKTLLSKYKIKNIQVKCDNNDEFCSNKKYELTLQDGTTKTVNELD